jgi:Fe-S cluster biosynthesis and repair protein YggX
MGFQKKDKQLDKNLPANAYSKRKNLHRQSQPFPNQLSARCYNNVGTRIWVNSPEWVRKGLIEIE